MSAPSKASTEFCTEPRVAEIDQEITASPFSTAAAEMAVHALRRGAGARQDLLDILGGHDQPAEILEPAFDEGIGFLLVEHELAGEEWSLSTDFLLLGVNHGAMRRRTSSSLANRR